MILENVVESISFASYRIKIILRDNDQRHDLTDISVF